MIISFFLLSFAFAETSDTRNLIEQTYTRDNTYCSLGKEKTQIQIRSVASKSEPGEKKYGEHLVYYPSLKPKLLPLNLDQLNTYRFFAGESSICSKSLAFRIDKNIVAILFLKENRPQRDKLTIQLFNTASFTPEKVLETDYMTDEASQFEDGFVFNSFIDRLKLEMGKIQIETIDYTYQDRDFPIWMKYNKNGFEINPTITYNKFAYKHFFKDEADFLETSGWDKKGKTFKNTILFMAINYAKKKECLLLSESKVKMTGAEPGWRCQTVTKAE
jgi:hypothetical protein